MRVPANRAYNVWHVAQTNRDLWIQDKRSTRIPEETRGVFIYVRNLGGLGRRTGIQHSSSLTIREAEALVSQLKQAIKEAREIESLEPQYHAAVGNAI